MNMKKIVLSLTALWMLLSLAACGSAPEEAAPRQGSGLRSTGVTVSDLLESAVASAAPSPTAAAASVEEVPPAVETAPPETAAPTEAPEPPEAAPSPAEDLPEEAADTPAPAPGEIDLDLTLLSSGLVYSEVFNMMVEPEAYVGKTIRLSGYCVSNYYEPTDMYYYAVVIPDATACCAQGIEFLLREGETYPPDDADVVVTGTFELYEEMGMEFCRLGDAVITA